jgi:type I restriction enzyme S subunit
MPLPPTEEQREIVEYLDQELEKFENSVEKVREGIDQLKEYRTALITEAVTGQIDIPEEN